MTDVLTPNAKQQFFTNNGDLAVGYRLFSYAAGTTTKLATHTSSTGLINNSNPITLNFRGEADVWIPPNVAYKFVFAPPGADDPPSAPIWTVDNVVSSQLVTLWGGVDTGSANNYVLTFAANFTTYTDGIVIYWIPSNTNFGPSTLNVNGLGAAAIVKPDGTAITSTQLLANTIYEVIYRSGSWIIMNSAPIRGTFSGTFSGVVTPPSATINYLITGRSVTVTLPAFNGTSNAVVCTVSGFPTFLNASVITRMAVPAGIFQDNSINNSTICALVDPGSPGIMTFIINGNAAGFTAAGTKGFTVPGATFTWILA